MTPAHQPQALVDELERRYGPARAWRRFRPERRAERERRERHRLADERCQRGESPFGDGLPF